VSTIQEMLTGGHPNSLGNTIEVVESILKGTLEFEELYQCYFSEDEVVRLRVSNSIKRIYKERPEAVEIYLDKFLNDISIIDQPSTQWTMTQLFLWMTPIMSPSQLKHAKEIVKRYISTTQDWIVENTTLETLATWAKQDPELKKWLKPVLEKYATSTRKSVASRAKKLYGKLYE
jgi:hypothetical protein